MDGQRSPPITIEGPLACRTRVWFGEVTNPRPDRPAEIMLCMILAGFTHETREAREARDTPEIILLRTIPSEFWRFVFLRCPTPEPRVLLAILAEALRITLKL